MHCCPNVSRVRYCASPTRTTDRPYSSANELSYVGRVSALPAVRYQRYVRPCVVIKEFVCLFVVMRVDVVRGFRTVMFLALVQG